MFVWAFENGVALQEMKNLKFWSRSDQWFFIVWLCPSNVYVSIYVYMDTYSLEECLPACHVHG